MARRNERNHCGCDKRLGGRRYPVTAARDGLQQRLSTRGAIWFALSVVVCDLLPVVVLLIVALVQGLSTGEYPEASGIGDTGTFPMFDPQIWTAWIPILMYALWILGTLSRPLAGQRFGRGWMLFFGWILLLTTGARVIGFAWSDRFPTWGARHMFLVIAVLGGLLVCRIVLGWLRLLPRSWRVPEPERLRESPAGHTPHDPAPVRAQQAARMPDSAELRNAQPARVGVGADRMMGCSIFAAVGIAVCVLVCLLIWGLTQAHWAFIAMSCGIGLFFCVLLSLVIAGVWKACAGAAHRRNTRRRAQEVHRG